MSGTRPTLTERDRVAPIPNTVTSLVGSVESTKTHQGMVRLRGLDAPYQTTRLDHCHRTNPRPCTEADLDPLLDRAW